MFSKTTPNRWILALVTVAVLAFAAPQTAAAAPLQAEPAGVSVPDALFGWAAQLWQDFVNTFDATTTEPDPEPDAPSTTTNGEAGGMIDPNG